MCLIAIAWKVSPRWPLLLLGNRDESHARPSAPLARWRDAPQVLAGRDLEAGGTWMGVSADGRAAVVTNVRDPGADLSGRSRGHLVADYLRGRLGAAQQARTLAPHAAGYRPFNLLLCDAHQARFIGNHPGVHETVVTPGVHGLSNADFDTPWPKTRVLMAHLEDWLHGDQGDFAPLFTALADEARWPDDALPDTGVGIALERELSAAFIRGQRYGTRASTLVAVDPSGHGRIIEHRFGPDGVALGETTLAF